MNVADHHVVDAPEDFVDTGGAVDGDLDVVPGVAEHLFQRLAETDLVLDEQDV
jgi:hypothetical protein